MNALAILAHLKAAGVRVSRRGDNLLAEPRAAVTEPLLILMRAHKCELLAALSDQSASLPTAPATIAPEQRGNPGAGHPANAELRALVDAVAAFHGFTPDQTAEAQQIAEADHVAALECFRSLAERDGIASH